MAVEFNKYTNYNLLVGKEASKKSLESEKKEEVKEQDVQLVNFKGLENETDLLTQNAQNLYGVKIDRFSALDKTIANETNKILSELGYNFTVDTKQVASIANTVNKVVLPALNEADNKAVAARISDPNGPFADLFGIKA